MYLFTLNMYTGFAPDLTISDSAGT